MNPKPQLSAIWICSTSDHELEETLRSYLHTLSLLPYQCELILVGHGSDPEAVRRLLPILEQSSLPSTIVSLPDHTGESTGILAGLQESKGELVALLPSYLQSDPDALHGMLRKIEEGADYVASWRYPRIDMKKYVLKSNFFNFVTRYLTGVELHDINSGLRVMKRQVTEHAPIYGDLHRFLPVLAEKQGYRVVEMKTRHLHERVKKGDYGLGVYLRRMLDLLALFFLMKFTRKPLRFFGLLGSGTLALGAVVTLVVCIERLFGTALADRPVLILGVFLVVLGIQLFSLGLLGELIIFTYRNQMREPSIRHIHETVFHPEEQHSELVSTIHEGST